MQRERTRPQQDDDLPQSSDDMLTAKDAPVLAEFWDNDDDAVYDNVESQEGQRETEEDIRAGHVEELDRRKRASSPETQLLRPTTRDR